VPVTASLSVAAGDWAVFGAAVATLVVVDFWVARARQRTTTIRSAAFWSGVWIATALLFAVWVAARFGSDAGLTYLTAYLLEKSLSVDNLFVFALIFSHTSIPPALQHRALFWGIAGTLIMRAVLIALGIYLLDRFHWVIYPFAALLLYSGVRMLRGEDKQLAQVEAHCSICTSWIARFIPITPNLEGSRFLVRRNGRWTATPLLVALVVIETSDLVFAIDSIPAVFGITRDPFLVYTSNVFALLGLRSLYFLLSGAMRKVRFLRPALAIMLVLVAIKMLLSEAIDIPTGLSLALIASIFTAAVVASWLFPVAKVEMKS
jgi:tellurite resistance protein TerC